MLQRGVLFLVLIVSFTGCAITHKVQTRTAPLISTDGQENPSVTGTDKVWVEAETKKIWVNSQVDENGDMVEGHYKHIIVTPGHWAVKDGGKK